MVADGVAEIRRANVERRVAMQIAEAVQAVIDSPEVALSSVQRAAAETVGVDYCRRWLAERGVDPDPSESRDSWSDTHVFGVARDLARSSPRAALAAEVGLPADAPDAALAIRHSASFVEADQVAARNGFLEGLHASAES